MPKGPAVSFDSKVLFLTRVDWRSGQTGGFGGQRNS